MTTDKQRATSLLQHYLKFGLEAAGYRWDSDNQSEVADIVDSIIAAATATPAQPAMDPDPVIQARQWARMFNERMPNAYGIEFGGEDSDLTRIDISFEDSALTRIAIALEHIAERLDEVSARGKLLDFPPKPKPAERPAPDTTLG